MPIRATKRGADRSLLGGEYDVLVCGASFAGLAVARELADTRARVLVVDRYEIGERQTSACAAPTEWLTRMGLGAAIRQTFDSVVVHTPTISRRWPIPWTFSTFDYRQLCELLWEQCGDAAFETAKVDGKEISPSGEVMTIRTDRGDLRSALVVDALGWRRVLGPGANVQPPDAPLSRGLEAHPAGASADLEIWIDPRYLAPGYGWSFPAGDELRIGVGSFDPEVPVKNPTVQLIDDLGTAPNEWQGNWIPHRLRPAVEDGVFFAGDSAGHCLPLTAEGIRTALYFGIACGAELRAVVQGRRDRDAALRRYGAFSAAHKWKFDALYLCQQSVRHWHGGPSDHVARALTRRKLATWAFEHYGRIAPPQAATAPRRTRAARPLLSVAG